MMQTLEGFPVSPQQRHLWQVSKAGPGSAYNARCAIRIEGDLDRRALQEAMDLVISRHEILRTVFLPVPGMKAPLQQVAATAPEPIRERSLESLSAAEQEAETAGALLALAAEPFDIEKGPVLRLALLRLAADRAVLLAVLPALCADDASLGGLARELAAAYSAVRGGAPLEEAIQYADVAQWQNDLLDAEEVAAGREHWADRRLHESWPARWPFEGLRAAAAFAPAAVPVPLAEGAAAGLQTLAARHGVPAGAPLLTCWGLLFWRRTGGEPLRLAVAADGRRFSDLKGALGPLTKYLPLPFSPVAGESFTALLERTAAAEREAYQHQEYFSWEGAAGGARKGIALPVCFELQDEPAQHRAGGVVFSVAESHAWIDRCKLALTARVRGGRLTAELHYDPSLFTAADAACLASQTAALAAAAVADPAATIDSLPLADATGRRQVLEAFNATRQPFPDHLCLHQLIEEQARLHPEATAVVHEGERLTYAELDRRAAGVATVLRGLGVGPDVPVAIFAERTPAMIVAILGTLKAGGAYVPLDPSNPRERIGLILGDCAAPVLLTVERLLADLPANVPRVVCVDRLEGSLAAGAEDGGPEQEPTPDNLAYVIYTSGSTGRPKGVLVSHRNAVHSTTARFLVYREPVEAFVLLSSFAFDSSVAGIFWTLSQGGTLLLPREELQWDLPSLASLIDDEGASHLLCLPSLYALLLEQTETDRLSTLRAVLVAGEACSPEVIARHAAQLPAAALYNEYGPTETTVWCSVAEIGHLAEGEAVPIGHPIPNAQLFILRPDGEPCAIGEPGELHAAGAGVTRGYLTHPDLTAERFVPHAFTAEPGSRIYRTGDLARYRLDGIVDYLGRIDHQVKIRGFRVELGEIESPLVGHPAIFQAVVTAREEAPGDLRLVAYVVFRENARAPTVAELRLLLHQKLPEYMVPAAFVVLPGLPLNANGKLDRKALPAPGDANRHRPEYVAPRSEIESTIAAIWCDVLQMQKIGVHDNFFDLGGQSLLMVRVNRKLRETLGCDVSVLEMFRFPTVSALAEFLSAGGSEPRKAAPEEGRGEARKAHGERRRDNLEKRRATRQS